MCCGLSGFSYDLFALTAALNSSRHQAPPFDKTISNSCFKKTRPRPATPTGCPPTSHTCDTPGQAKWKESCSAERWEKIIPLSHIGNPLPEAKVTSIASTVPCHLASAVWLTSDISTKSRRHKTRENPTYRPLRTNTATLHSNPFLPVQVSCMLGN